MRILQEYWREVRELERTLPDFVWLMSLEDPQRGHVGGVLAEVPAESAAKFLHAKSHRVATPEEITLHLHQSSEAARQELHEGLRREGITVVPVVPAPVKSRPRNVR